MRHFLALLFAVSACASALAQDMPANFDALKTKLWPQAQAKGVNRATFDLAFRSIAPIRALSR